MDDSTREIVENFVNFMNTELSQHKHYKTIQFGKWSLKDHRLSLEYIYQGEHKKLYVDFREVKENQDRLTHLLPLILEKLGEVE